MRTPEIHAGEPFGAALTELIISYGVDNVVEVGAWDGLGSTQCLLNGLSQYPTGGSDTKYNRTLTSYEIDEEKYDNLCINVAKWHAANQPKTVAPNGEVTEPLWVWTRKVCGTPVKTMPSWADIKDYCKDFPNLVINQYITTGEAEQWYNRDKEVLANARHVPFPPITGNALVLLDGGEFTGLAELYEVLKHNRANRLFIALDDVNSYKHHESYAVLHSNNTLISEGNHRNGWSIFEVN